MSCYEWEGGEIKLPTKIFASFRKEFITGWNEIQQRKMDNLKSWRATALRDGSGKRNYDFKDRMLCMASNYVEEELVEMLFEDNRKPKMPTKKMFTFANGKSFGFDIGEAYIGFKKPCVGWSVHENNHACESAHATPEAKLLFRLLSRVEWTRGSGGVIVGNNEYHRDDWELGGGGNYEVMSYGKDRKSTRLNSSHVALYSMPSSA